VSFLVIKRSRWLALQRRISGRVCWDVICCMLDALWECFSQSVVSRGHYTFDALGLALFSECKDGCVVQHTWMLWKKTLKNFLECNKDATITYTPCLCNSLYVLKVQCFASGSVSSLNNLWNREKNSWKYKVDVWKTIKFICVKFHSNAKSNDKLWIRLVCLDFGLWMEKRRIIFKIHQICKVLI